VEQVAQRIGIIQDGQLRYQGPLSELRASVRRLRPLPPAAPVEPLAPPLVDAFASGEPETEATASVMPTAEAIASVMPAAEAAAPEPLPPEAPEYRPMASEVPAVEAAPAPVFPPEGFTVIRREGDSVIAFAEPSLWESAHQAARVEPLSLEDIFLAYARKGGA
jgi:ABC-type multidrug transport system ATPase subunit